MVHLRGMVHEGWHMVQEAKSWYDYIIMVRPGSADGDSLLYTRNKKSVENVDWAW